MPAQTLIVIAKAPVPGKVKTRLTPPCTPEQAAGLARAAIEDTLAAVAAVGDATRRVLVLDGTAPPDLVPPGFETIPQRGVGLAERLANAFADAGGGLLVGMDTPQVTPELLAQGMRALAEHDAVLAPTLDGGYWCIGLRAPDPEVFAGVPMSEGNTGAVQRARLVALGLDSIMLPILRDVDTIEDARAVATQSPGLRFSAAVEAL